MRKILVALIAFVLFSQCQINNRLHPVEQTRILMDTIVQIVVFHPEKNEEQLQGIINRAFQRMEQIDSLTNNYNDSSQISLVNKNAFSRAIVIDTSLTKILRLGLDVSKKSDGNFDMTVGAIKKLWPFGTDSNQVPDSGSIKRNLKFVNYKLVELSGNTVRFKKSGVNLDLGGIAKGYAIDEAMRIIKEAGIQDAMVNAGGDLRVISGKLTRGKRRILVKHPRKESAIVGYFPLDSGSVATSGDYERFFVRDSVRYHHILDPQTGYPSRKCVSVTVQTTNATIADALATAIFVMGPAKGMVFVNKLPDTEALIIFQNENGLDYIASAGLAKKFVPSEDWQSDEKIMN